MPLRPVSELGLMEVTDLASRDHDATAAPSPQTRARRTRAQSPRPDSGGDPRGRRTVDQPERARGSAKGGRQTGRSNAKQTGGSTPKGSGRSQSGASPTAAGSGTSPSRAAKTPKRSSTPQSLATGSNGAVKTRNGTSRETRSASADEKSQNQNTAALVAKIGIPVMTSAIGVAGGILLSGKGLQRRHKILGTSLPNKVDIDLGRASARIGKASRRVGNLAGEMRNVRERTQQLGRALG